MSSDGSRRLGRLLGLPVLYASGEPAGRVSDVRVTAAAGTVGYAAMTVTGLVVASRGSGSLLGYDRNREQGPWLVATIVGLLHRDTGYVDWSEVAHVDWEAGVVHLRVDRLQELRAP
jgi:PRC-barrel domain protein